jgi:hypothetical protein
MKHRHVLEREGSFRTLWCAAAGTPLVGLALLPSELDTFAKLEKWKFCPNANSNGVQKLQ